MKLLLALIISVSAHAQWRTEVSDAEKKETCEIAREVLLIKDSIEECVKAEFEMACYDWCIHNMSNGDIVFEKKGSYWGTVMINRDDKIERKTFYGKNLDN